MEVRPFLSPFARLIEALLFLESDPLSIPRLVQLSGLDEGDVTQALDEIAVHWRDHMHGLDLVETQGAYQFVPCADLHERLRECYGKKVDRRLSKAALETLSIIAYAQPVCRREIERIRGVSSDTIIRLLLERAYIAVVGRKDVPGRPCLYGTTKKFLFAFNLPSISALPKLSEIDKLRFDRQEASDGN